MPPIVVKRSPCNLASHINFSVVACGRDAFVAAASNHMAGGERHELLIVFSTRPEKGYAIDIWLITYYYYSYSLTYLIY